MNTNQALSELNNILQKLQEKESLCDRRLLQKNELNDLYASLPEDIKSCVFYLDDISQRIFTKTIQIHNAHTKWEHQDLTNIARKKIMNHILSHGCYVFKRYWRNILKDLNFSRY